MQFAIEVVVLKCSFLKHIKEFKRHFILQPSDERTMNSNNLIGGEQSFVCWAFIVYVNSQKTTASKTLT
jgi:hypothetical protein